jgi:hypothetical protein
MSKIMPNKPKYTYWSDEFGSFHEELISVIDASQDIDAPLMRICNSDHRFQPGESYTIFGRDPSDLTWVYSDRLWEWDRTRAEKANEAAKASGVTANTPRYYQEFLRAYYDKPELKLICIQGGYNAFTLYTFYVYGYKM